MDMGVWVWSACMLSCYVKTFKNCFHLFYQRGLNKMKKKTKKKEKTKQLGQIEKDGR